MRKKIFDEKVRQLEDCTIISNNTDSFIKKLEVHFKYAEDYCYKIIFGRFGITFPVKLIDLGNDHLLVVDNLNHTFFFELNLYYLIYEYEEEENTFKFYFMWKNLLKEFFPCRIDVNGNIIQFSNSSIELVISHFYITIMLKEEGICDNFEQLEYAFDIINKYYIFLKDSELLFEIETFKMLFNYLFTISVNFSIESPIYKLKVDVKDGIIKFLKLSYKEGKRSISLSYDAPLELADFELLFNGFLSFV